MADSSVSDNRKKIGRPSTGIGKPIGVRLYPDQLAKLDDWIATQSPQATRPEAIRTILGSVLK